MEKKLPGMLVDLHPGEKLLLAGKISVNLLHKSGQVARLRVVAPPDVSIKKDSYEETSPRLAS